MKRTKFTPVVKYTSIAILAVSLGSMAGLIIKNRLGDHKFVCVKGLYYEESSSGDLVLQKSTDGRGDPILCQG